MYYFIRLLTKSVEDERIAQRNAHKQNTSNQRTNLSTRKSSRFLR